MLTLADLLARGAALKARHAQLRSMLDRVQHVAEAVQAHMDRLDEDEAFRRGDKAHRARVTQDLTREYLPVRVLAAGVALYLLEHELPALDRDLRAFKQRSMRQPDAVETYLARSNGSRAFLRDEAEQLLFVADELRRSRFRDELRTAQPSSIAERYRRALNDDGDESASFLRWCEDAHGDGWSGAQPESDDQIQSAVDLRRAIAEAEAARVPAELADLEASIEAGRILARRANDPKLYGVALANPNRDDTARAAFEQEASEIAELAAAGAGSQ